MTDARREPVSEHYSDGRRYSFISNAWILADSWNDREEVAALRNDLTLRKEELRQEREKSSTLADRLAESEAQVKELEHEANQEGQQFRQFAEEILPPGMRVSTEGAISFGKLKEVVEAAIAAPARDLAKLKQRLAEVERERDDD